VNSFLIEQFPDAIEIDGEIFAVNTDFRVGLQIMADFENPEFDQDEHTYLMLNRLYVDLPADRDTSFYQKAAEKAVRFLNAGDDTEKDTEGKPRLYSFRKDARLIYSAFSQTHGVDLQTDNMHWWRFIALFMDLGADTAFNSMVGLRKRYYDGKLTDEERRLVAEMGDGFLVEQSEVYDQLDPEELRFISLLPEEDQKRFWEGRKEVELGIRR
jgi:hypothetical protein